jgi:4'-phosphopantetheinyl transferase EntD
MLASRLFDAPVGTAEMDPRSSGSALFPEEETAIAGAIPKRRLEFTAGRTCARRAMAAIGEPPRPIPQLADRAPLWPQGLVGSISHANTWCAAAVARISDGVIALGLDIEPYEPIKHDLLRIICLPEERDFIDSHPVEERGLLAKTIFSAKECAYKCQYALSRTFLGFHAMRILLNPPGNTFLAVFQRDAGAAFAAGQELPGRFLVDQGYVATAMVLTKGE